MYMYWRTKNLNHINIGGRYSKWEGYIEVMIGMIQSPSIILQADTVSNTGFSLNEVAREFMIA